MKSSYFLIILLMTATYAFAGNPNSHENDSRYDGTQKTQFNINNLDSVVFDISQAVMAGNQVAFPVYIQTDDTINSVDFSFQFDEVNFSLDTIINLTTYLMPTYNINASTLYFTSYSLQNIDHNTPLLTVRFNMLGHYLCSNDLSAVLGYLNGDPCSVKILNCTSDRIDEMNAGSMIQCYPNPSSGMVNVSTFTNATLEVIDLSSSKVMIHENMIAHQVKQLNTTGCAKGIYLLRSEDNDGLISTRKLIID